MRARHLAIYFMQQMQYCLQQFRANYVQMMFSLLGIIIGSASVVLVMLITSLSTQSFFDKMSLYSQNVINISLAYPRDNNTLRNTTSDILDKIEGISEDFAEIEAMVPLTYHFFASRMGEEWIDGVMVGVEPRYLQALGLTLATGRMLIAEDEYRLHALFGERMHQQIHSVNPGSTNSQVVAEQRVLSTVGVLQHAQQQSYFPFDLDESIILPMQSMVQVEENQQINDLFVVLKVPRLTPQRQKELITALRGLLGFEHYHVRDSKDLVAELEEGQQSFRNLLWVNATIAFLCGGVGIMNVMMVSLIQRRKEIGLRMAVGATQQDIMMLFLCESLTLAFIGAIMGLLVAGLIAVMIVHWMQWQWHWVLTPWLLGLLLSFVSGLMFGWYPAKKAAALDPIVSLRHE